MSKTISGYLKADRRIKLATGISRRDFLKYSGTAGGALLFGMQGDLVMANRKSRVAFVSTEDRKSG
ncbi:MAG: twin-arginine translocation signal domain-containing protein, partial [Desulfobacterales bacterium]|nr:twin-arginine translocation signal domain-containing protein [Desulfobacterales bacterium]